MIKSPIVVNVHRYRDKVAVSLHTSPTVYLSPEDARRFALELTRCATDAMHNSFPVSEYRLVTIQFAGHTAE